MVCCDGISATFSSSDRLTRDRTLFQRSRLIPMASGDTSSSRRRSSFGSRGISDSGRPSAFETVFKAEIRSRFWMSDRFGSARTTSTRSARDGLEGVVELISTS